MEKIISAKFGGTSMGTAESIMQVAEIIEKLVGGEVSGEGNWGGVGENRGDREVTGNKKIAGIETRVAVVVSASSGTTDSLIDLAKKAMKGENWEEVLEELMKKHEEILRGLGLNSGQGSGDARAGGDDGADNYGRGAGRWAERGSAGDAGEQFEKSFPAYRTGRPGETVGGEFLQNYFDQIRKLAQGVNMMEELSLSALDKIMSFGERISSEILAAYLNKRRDGVGGSGGREGTKALLRLAAPCDAYNFVFTDNNFGEGNVDFEKTNAAIKEQIGGLLDKGVIPIITGFVGQAANGHYITLGRGGSDYTGAIVGAALDASEVQIWTDVDGIFTTDPRLVPEAKVLEQLSFAEAGELAYFGAKVLHPKTIKPAIEKNIPVRILNTFNVEAPGTLITNEERQSLKSVTYRKGVSIISVCSAGMLEARGFMAKLFEVFARHQIAVDVVSTSEVSVSLTVDNNCSEKVLNELRQFATVEVKENMAIVCLVGEGIRFQTAALGKLFTAIADYDVSMVSQGASKRNITFLVQESEVKDVVKRVFEEFFGN